MPELFYTDYTVDAKTPEGITYMKPHNHLNSPCRSHPALPEDTENTATADEWIKAPNFAVPSDRPIQLSLLQAQIRHIKSSHPIDGDIEKICLCLINHCEQFQGKLTAHSLPCYTALVQLYEDEDDMAKKLDILERAEKAVLYVLDSENRNTKDDLTACFGVAKHLVMASRYESAHDIFSQIEHNVQEIFGSDHLITIWFLEEIGYFYQEEGRWEDAVPRFEHALAAQLSRYGAYHENVRRLEAALENGHFDKDTSFKDDNVSSFYEYSWKI